MENEVVEGYILNYIYEATDSLYKVCKIMTKDDEELTIVGSFPRLDDVMSYKFIGKMNEHPKFGRQFSVLTYEKGNAFSKDGLIIYLSGDKFKGIGAKLATNIVDALGTDCIQKILDDKNSLDNVKGLNDAKKDLIYEVIKSNYLTDDVFIRLYGFGLTPKMAGKIYEAYGLDSANIIEENPYLLITEVDGFGFQKCDLLALNLGFKDNDIKRLKAAICYTINYVCYQNGFTFLTHEQLINSAINLLNNNPNISKDDFENALNDLISKGKLVNEDERIFDTNLYKAECELASKINKIKKSSKEGFKEDDVKEALNYVENLIGINYTPLQKDAIINSLSNRLSIITGGPGTGKSTILKGILNTYAHLLNASLSDDIIAFNVLLVAPTGRAAKRMTEVANFKASTIHKALGYGYDQGFSFNEYNLLPNKLVIVDEASMLDIELARNLFNALSNDVSIILIGDANQLPSVSPGNVLVDLINSQIFKTTKLTQIMRQAEDSSIIKLSHMILNENILYNIFSIKKDLFFYNFDTKDVIEGIFRILDRFILKGGDIVKDIQILAPMYAGVAGIDEINKQIQERYNKSEKMIVRDNAIFKVNDKVLQLKNDAVLDIMNGDIGRIIDICKIDEKDYLLIDFDGKLVSYSAMDLDNLKLGYAISIHKSQGSEFDNVILPILPSYRIMLKKKIIYTAVTRAKKKLILVGKLESLDYAIKTMDPTRQTALYNRLVDMGKNSIDNKIFDPEIPFEYLGEYDMEGITPYSFMDNE